jgi:lipopolysaccharide heptosyltransferase I
MRILIVKTSSLGDLFHALPTVHLLKDAFGAEIDWVVNAEYVKLVECFTDVRKAIPFPRRSLLANAGAFRRELRRESYDLVVDLQGLLKSALICRMARRSRDARILGPSFQREGAKLFYSAVAGEKNKNRHAVEENLDVLKWLEKPEEPVKFPVQFPEVDFPFFDEGPVVVFAPCSRHEAKNWPTDRFAELGQKLNAHIVIVGTSEDALACKSIERALPRGRITNLCGKTSLLELGGVLQKSDLVITVDSGPMHMASASGTPCLAIFGPTDPVRVGPYGPQHRILREADVKTYSKQDMDSIRLVKVNAVYDAVMDMLSHETLGL